MDLSTDYAGNMGSGIIDAVKLLDLVEGKENGVALSVPNIYLRPGEKKTQAVHRFFDNGENLSYTVSVENPDIAEVSVSGSEVTVKGLAKGSTRYTRDTFVRRASDSIHYSPADSLRQRMALMRRLVHLHET